jgi:Flp pilus assembly protein TadD
LHHALGLTYVRQGRKAEALAELRRATELDPSDERFKYVYDVARQELQ